MAGISRLLKISAWHAEDSFVRCLCVCVCVCVCVCTE